MREEDESNIMGGETDMDLYTPVLLDGEPCNHPGCLHHVTHPCEGCGRIAGRKINNFPQGIPSEE